MSFLVSRLGQYVLWRTLVGVSIVLGAIAATILLVDVVEQLRSIGTRAGLSLWGAVGLTMLKAPRLLEQTLPFIMLVGVMIAMNGLNRRSELIAIRASGVSAWRFLSPAVVLAVLFGVLATTALNPLGSRMYEQFEAEKARLLGERLAAERDQSLWLRQGDDTGHIVIHANNLDPKTAQASNALFYFFSNGPDGALTFTRRVIAGSAKLEDGFWQLADVVEASPGAAAARMDHLAIPTTISKTSLFDRFVTPATLSFWRLPNFIADMRRAGLAPLRYEIKWHSLLAFPALMAAMAAIGAAFSLRLNRLGGGAMWTLGGLAGGFGLFFTTQLAAALANAEILPPLLAAWAPPVAGFFGALAIMSFQEDG